MSSDEYYPQQFRQIRRRQLKTIEREQRILAQDDVIVCPDCSGTGSGPYERNGYVTFNAGCNACKGQGFMTLEEYAPWIKAKHAYLTERSIELQAQAKAKREESKRVATN